MAPFRNPFAPKPKPDGPAPPSGAEVLMERVRRDATRRSGRDSSPSSRIMATTTARNYGNGGSWPEAAEARRRGRCPRCDADTSEARRARARGDGKVDPMGDPVEQARFGQHRFGVVRVVRGGEQAPRRQRRVLILNEAEDLSRESIGRGRTRARWGRRRRRGEMDTRVEASEHSCAPARGSPIVRIADRILIGSIDEIS